VVTSDMPVVVIDAGPVIHLDELDCLDLLGGFSSLLTPETVWAEVRRHRPSLNLGSIPGLCTASVTQPPSEELFAFVETLNLDAGETAALTLAEQKGAGLFLTDDSAARLAGESRGLRVHGTIGILLRSIRRGTRARSSVLGLLVEIRQRSSLYLSERLLNEVIDIVKRDS